MAGEIAEHEIVFRPAKRRDLPAIVRMLADDPLGAKREVDSDPLPASYESAFAAIDADSNNELVVAEYRSEPVGVFQITFIPYLTYQGGWRALIEGVRVAGTHRSSGIGRLLIRRAIDRARERGCVLAQLTTDKSRPEALSFYERLGFVASHEGLKLILS